MAANNNNAHNVNYNVGVSFPELGGPSNVQTGAKVLLAIGLVYALCCGLTTVFSCLLSGTISFGIFLAAVKYLVPDGETLLRNGSQWFLAYGAMCWAALWEYINSHQR